MTSPSPPPRLQKQTNKQKQRQLVNRALLHLSLVILGSRRRVYRRILVYIFCLISIGLSLSNEANKMKFLNIERT